jgi:Transcriptional regulator containing an amidase domain and an AraC-type DNA-binding HTH domain
MAAPTTIGVMLFADFETLDVFGPVQMWGHMPNCRISFVSADGRPARSSQGVTVEVDHSFQTTPSFNVLMVPGGTGTRNLIDDAPTIQFLRACDRSTDWTTSVCTGAALLARAGLLTGRAATTNKRAFEWVRSLDEHVNWQGSARWVRDGKFLTSSGVSAGTDMALALVELLRGRKVAEGVARTAEYMWNHDPTNDPFAVNVG